MAINSLHIGTASSVATGSVTPAFGAATTAGNLLTCCVSVRGTGFIGLPTTTQAGWTQINTAAFTGTPQLSLAIWYKPNCGASETAPTFTCTGTISSMYAQLVEWRDAMASPLDSSGSIATGLSPWVATCAAADAAANDLIVVAYGTEANKTTGTATFTPTFTPTGGALISLATDQGTTQQQHSYFAQEQITTGGAAADSCSMAITNSTGSIVGTGGVIASFKPLPLPVGTILHVQDVFRASINTAAAAQTTNAFAAATTVGNTVVVAVTLKSTTTLTVSSVSGGGVGTFQRAGTAYNPATGLVLDIWYGTVTSAATTAITATWSAVPTGATGGTVLAAEFSGVSGLDQVASNTATTTTMLTANLTPAVADELVIAVMMPSGPITGASTPSPYYPFGSFGYPVYTGTPNNPLVGCYLSTSDAAAHQGSWPINVSDTWYSQTALFKPTAPLYVPQNQWRNGAPLGRAANWMEQARGLVVPRRELWRPELVTV